MSDTGLEILVDFGDNWLFKSTCDSDKNVSYINSLLAFPFPVACFLITVGGIVTYLNPASLSCFLSIPVFSPILKTLPVAANA